MCELLAKTFYLVAVLGVLVLAESRSYEGAQVLRISNYKNISTLETNFGGSIWKEGEDFIDVSFEKEKLQDAKNFMNTAGIKFEIFISDIQNLIDNENPVSSLRSGGGGMSWDQYHGLDTIYNFLRRMKTQYPDLVKLIKIGQSIKNRNLFVLRISSNAVAHKKIWIDAGVHAREWIAPATCTYLINYILSNWNNLNQNMKDKTWYFMPVVNPDGYEYTRTTDRLWRKNRRPLPGCDGVDLNRNYNANWNSDQQSHNPCDYTYSGASPFSEPETNAIRRFLSSNRNNLKAAISLHSYGQFILYPWGFKNTKAPNSELMDRVGRIAAENIRQVTGTRYTVGQDTILGLISGASDDWAKLVLKVPFAYTMELRDSGNFGFVLPAGQIIGTSKEVLELAKAVANNIAD